MIDAVRPLNLSLTMQDIDSARPVSVFDVLVVQGKPAFTIGSHEKSHLRIADPVVASAHAVITLRDGEYWIAPRYPQHAVLIDDLAIRRPTHLNPGSVVQLGGYTLRVDEQPYPELSASTSEPEFALSNDYIPRSAATIEDTSAQVFFPRRPPQERSSRKAVFLGLLVIALIAVGGYVLYNNVLQPSTNVLAANPFSFGDGNATLLMFDATWCGRGCVDQKSILQQVAGEFRGDVYINYADVDLPDNQALLMQLQVDVVPFVAVFNDQGDLVTTFPGGVDSASLYQAVTAALRLSKGSSLPSRDS